VLKGQQIDTVMRSFLKLSAKHQAIPIGNLRVQVPVPPEQQESGDRLSFWWAITSAAIALSRRLEEMGDLVGERAIELGCGVGLVGCTAALLGATVTFSDYVEDALAFSRETCRLNPVRLGAVRFERLDWEKPEGAGTFSLVLGSEIAYDYFTHAALIRLIDRILEPTGITLLAERKRLVVSRLLGRLTHRGYRVSESVTPVAVSGFPEQEISIFTIYRACPRETD
jgi:2-polyprenyl-3-methyl-5-hydroxy-6-metoxy-1,4-benzoquinol methylase